MKLCLAILSVLLLSQAAHSCNFWGIVECTDIILSPSINQLTDDVCGYYDDFTDCMAPLEEDCRGHVVWLTYRNRFRRLCEDN